MYRKATILVVVLVLMWLSLGSAWADVKLPSIFGDHMVLQCDQPIRIWGWADPGERVTVRIAQDSKTVTTSPQGRWQVTLDALAAGKAVSVTVQGNNTLTLNDVLTGEVWICSGQSNMQWSFERSITNGEAEVAAANFPKIRLITVPRKTATSPQPDFQGQWQACTPDSVKSFSAVGYFFGRTLNRELNRPIGLISTNWGGTRVEAWTSMGDLNQLPAAHPILDRWQEMDDAYDPIQVRKQYEAALEKWEKASAKAKAEGKKAPGKPRMQADPQASPHYPANLYNGMIAPLVPLSLQGAIWYQGESNVGRAYQYRELFPLMIRNWRRDFQDAGMPFGFVQLAPYARYGGDREGALAELWEAQLMTLKNLDNIGMAVTTDIATVNNIHPPNKQDVGKRLGLWALASIYGENIIYSGPIYQGCERHGQAMSISFSHVGTGLNTRDGQVPSHFTIAGADKAFHPAQAKIVGSRVVVSSEEVADPVAVRFAWSNTAEPNLQNKEGLPASPFRTDDWPGVTVDNYRP
jgi:sialate O-acetylesterase